MDKDDCYNTTFCEADCENCKIHKIAVESFESSEDNPPLNIREDRPKYAFVPLEVARTALAECSRGKAYGAASVLEKEIRRVEGR